MNNSNRLRFIILGVLVVIVITLYYQGLLDFFTFEYFKAHLTAIQEYINNNYLVSVIAFISTLTTLIALCIPLGILTPLISGLLFGWLPGATYAIIGSTLGACIAFFTSRFLIGHYFQQRFSQQLQAFNKELNQYGYIYLLGLHFFPITPFFILNLLSGLTKISSWTFIWTTIVGITPAFLIYTYIGNEITEINELQELLSGKILIAFISLKILSLFTITIGRFGPTLKHYFKGKK